MGLVEGGQLDAVAKREPIPIRDAAELIAKLARTVSYAHEHGILHRDIKPGNILLDAKGEPHLTDFGLARLVETESTVTHTMEVLGTPSYMAPEQAVGNHARDSGATDIYGLGAVLYQLLTAHPPFAGGTTYETIRLVLDSEPRRPRLLNPKVDRDLNTICLKCLEKDPQRRYSSALALAEDLERWLKHEPIRARRTGLFTRGRKWVRRNPTTAVLVVALAAVMVAMIWKSDLVQRPVTTGIAVLPFENRSEDKANAYFVDGIQDEILTRLSKIADLKVIAGTSTQHYKSGPRNLPEIARQLGVADILEGSVQKSGDTVRVNVQLIKAANDSHLWADTFDRKVKDIFSVDSEVAKAIAEQLRAKLTGQEEQAIAAKPTDNPEAYDAYLRGLADMSTTGNDLAAQKYLKEAVRLDPKFALAWARLSWLDAAAYRATALPPTVALREEARQAAETALTLQPNLGEAILAKGFFHYACLRDYDTAVPYLEQARQLLPNSSLVRESMATLERRRGHWDRSDSYFNEAEQLDPRNVHPLSIHAETYVNLRRFPEALRKFDQALNIMPDDVDLLVEKAFIAQAQGDLPRAAALLAPLHPNADNPDALLTQVYQAILERRPAQIIPRLKEILAKPDTDWGDDICGLRFYLGWAQEVAGDHAAAQESWRQAHSEFESSLKEQPENGQLMGFLALTNMALGDKAAAFKLVERNIATNPIEKDAVMGPCAIEMLARVAAGTGEPDRAIAALEKLLSIPYGGAMTCAPLTPALLRLDPMFDPLRNDPRFQKLVATGIAVLPFENRSEDKANAYLADGIQDEILTRLSKIADLKVIARTSTQHYKARLESLPEIAKQLDVAHILEGSVQKSGDAVRVNVQLINAATGSHLWADTFDRKLTDIFSVESEVAKAIAEQLRAKLTGQEEQVIAAKPTDNVEAYDAYLRGLALLKAANPDALATQKYLREAVRLDPKFALSWALLSWFDAAMYRSTGLPQTIALREEARQAAETALTLQPNLGEAVLATGFYHYACLRDYDTAVPYFEQARQLLPNSSLVLQSMAFLERRRGQWDRSESYFNEAERLDPRNADLLGGHALNYVLLRRFPEALRKFDQVLNITPDNVETVALKAVVVRAEGDLPRAAALLAPLHPNADTGAFGIQVYQAILEHRPAQIIPRLKEILAKANPAFGHGEQRFLLGWAQEVGGDHAAAQQTWRQARSELEFSLNGEPENDQLMGYLALTNAALGDKGVALKLVERAMAMSPIEKDAFLGPCAIEILARVAAQMGEPDRAIAALQKLLSIPYGGALGMSAPLTPELLRLDPMFDPLRNDPRFQKLVASPTPK
jgi:TolB-like protein/Tfp pilus assembly protein PilF